MTAKRFFTHPLGILGSAIVSTFLWGSAFPFIKWSYQLLEISSDEIGEQMLFAGYRFFLAGVLIFILFTVLGREMRYQKGTIVPLAKLGFFQTFLQYVLFYIGLSLSTGIQGSIIAGTTSFFQILLAHFMYRNDKMSTRKAIGLLVGFTGVVLVNITNGEVTLNFGLGEILLLSAMMISAYGNILARNEAQRMEVSYITSYQMLIGSVGLLLIGGFSVGFMPFSFTLQSSLILLYLAFLSAAGFVLWNNVMKYNQVGQVSMYLFLVPVFGVMLSSIILNEAIHMFVLLGLLFVASGIVIVNRSKRQVKEG
ncbi:transporter [Bacillus coahuilensis m2-6]|uniref:DMT family transporter n=1 Tax=Bacillus coahuilensis TaxID=408580 RepID=UPI0007506187|nr:DMT family transporter [Bacillus coahuilensis]KUP09869.1 transporter [Bacillus coahuilensis m2-6]